MCVLDCEEVFFFIQFYYEFKREQFLQMRSVPYDISFANDYRTINEQQCYLFQFGRIQSVTCVRVYTLVCLLQFLSFVWQQSHTLSLSIFLSCSVCVWVLVVCACAQHADSLGAVICLVTLKSWQNIVGSTMYWRFDRIQIYHIHKPPREKLVLMCWFYFFRQFNWKNTLEKKNKNKFVREMIENLMWMISFL